MNISLDIDQNLIDGMEYAAKAKGYSREDAFKEAIAEWLSYQPKQSEWLEDLQNLYDNPDSSPFEIDRPGPDTLPPDPFADFR